MVDETLTDKEIIALNKSLLEPFESGCVKGTSYDIRVGEVALMPPSQGESQVRAVAIGIPDAQMSITISPGATCTLRSLEKIHMPLNMKGRISLRAFHAKRLIFFAGGIVDPGYDDFLYLPLANLGDAPVELKYGDAIVTAEFVRLNKDAAPYKAGGEPPYKLAVPQVLFDRVKLSTQVQQHGESIEEIKKRLELSQTLINASQRILDIVVLGAVAAGAVTAVLQLFPSLSFPWNAVVLGLGAVFGLVAVTFLTRSKFRS